MGFWTRKNVLVGFFGVFTASCASTHRHCHTPNARTLCLQHISFNLPILGSSLLCISVPFITLRHQSVQLYQKKTTSCMGTSFNYPLGGRQARTLPLWP